jgi:multidrug efflux pump subunit AcrA (membrane-fusion protein)
MKRKQLVILILLAVVLLGGAGVYFATNKKPAGVIDSEKTLYTCGMHPQIIKDKPGDCPICGMKLQPVRKQSSPAAAKTGEGKPKYYKSTMMLGEISQTARKDSMGMDMVPVYEGESESTTITVDPVTVQKMGVRTAVVSKGPLRRIIRTVGSIDYNETALADVTTKFRGWIEILHVDSTGKQVKKGEPLFDIYSPDLYSAQNEYVLALNQPAGGASGLKASARQKLRLFDISEDQIAEMEKSRQPQRTLRVDAPIDGIVVEKMAVRGQMVEAGMKLYRLADLSIVWVQSQVYEQDLALVQVGQEAEVSLSYLPDRKFSGRVTYIYPTVDEKTRTAKVRMEFHNPGFFLKPGMFATVELRAELKPDALLVPDSAVLRSGEKNTAFVALEGGRFEPRELKLGPRADNDSYEVLSGLKEGERVVTSGQFMLDSESQLREAIQKMLNPVAPAAPTQTPVEPQNASVPVQAAPTPENKKQPQEYVCPTGYNCPMPEHMSIRYNHDGKCPICSMTLIPAPEAGTAPKPSPTAMPPGHQP